jgi:hypothetical protein
VDDKEIKVTDKRMFTPDGKLREEYRFLDEKSTAAEENASQAPTASPMPPMSSMSPMSPISPARPEGPAGPDVAPRVEAPARNAPPPPEPGGSARLEIPGTPPELGAPTFYDLAAILAEPVALYLGDLELEDGQSAENLEMARMHLDLLDVLRQKTMGNLTAQETAFLEDLLYRLRVRYVQKRG